MIEHLIPFLLELSGMFCWMSLLKVCFHRDWNRTGSLCVCWRNWLLLSRGAQSGAGHLPDWVCISRCNAPVWSVASWNWWLCCCWQEPSFLFCCICFLFKPLLCSGDNLLCFMLLYKSKTLFKFLSLLASSWVLQTKSSIRHFQYLFCPVPSLTLNSTVTAYTGVLEVYGICDEHQMHSICKWQCWFERWRCYTIRKLWFSFESKAGVFWVFLGGSGFPPPPPPSTVVFRKTFLCQVKALWSNFHCCY